MSFNSEFIDKETFTITDSKWVQLEKKDLMKLPWIRELVGQKDSKLFINSCFGFTVEDITEGGGIICSHKIRLYIKRNATRPARLQINEMYTNPDGIMESEPVSVYDIRKVTVSASYGNLPGGFMVFRDGPNKYYYDKNGNTTNYSTDNYNDYDYNSDSDFDY